MKILFVGHFGARNLGDELLLYSQIQMFEKQSSNGVEAYVYSYNHKTDYYEDYPYDIKQVIGFSFKKIFGSISSIYKTVREVDFVIVGGGGIIQDKYFVYRPLSTLLPAFIAFILRKPVYGFSLGIYKLKFGFNRWLVSLFLKQANLVTYRDSASKDSVNGLLNNKSYESIYIAPDSALGVRYSNSLVNIDEKYILVAIRDVFEEHLDILLETLLSSLKETNSNAVRIIVFEDVKEELYLSQKLKAKINNGVKVEIYEFPSVIEYLELISNSSRVLGGRLHACIPSFVLKKDVLGLAYEEKVSDFCESHGLKYSKIENLKRWYTPKGNISIEKDKLELEAYLEKIKNNFTLKISTGLLKQIKYILVLTIVLIMSFFIHILKIGYRNSK